MEEKNLYSVWEINQKIRTLVRSHFPSSFWVFGEIQDLKAYSQRRHLYFSLVEKHALADEIVSRINVVIYENVKNKIEQSLKNALAEDSSLESFLQEGRQIKALCRLNVYARRGNYYLEVYALDATYTLGKISQRRQELIKKLQKSGTLEKNKALLLSLLPLKIGLVTSYGSAAFFDFVSELKASCFAFKVLVYDAHMQGSSTEKEIIAALKFFNTYKRGLDAIVITRGGGSLADLSWFDSALIAQEIAKSRLPVLSALGHEINLTIADLAAWRYFKTPTKVAQFLRERIENFKQKIDDLERNILKQAQIFHRQQKDLLSIKLSRLSSLTSKSLSAGKSRLAAQKALIKSLATKFLAKEKLGLLRLKEQVKKLARLNIEKERLRLKGYSEKIEILKPERVLARGFSITFLNGRALKASKDAKVGDIIESVLFKGKIKSQVKETREEQV